MGAVGKPYAACRALLVVRRSQEDQRVLAADIKRTRQAYPMFKRDDVLKVVSETLERCVVVDRVSCLPPSIRLPGLSRPRGVVCLSTNASRSRVTIVVLGPGICYGGVGRKTRSCLGQ